MIMWINIDKLTEWKAVKEFSVGGLEWIGFSKEYSNKLLCISSQKCTLVDCTTGNYEECDCEYDELTYTAICSLLPNEIIKISGQYGEDILQSTKKNELIKAKILPDNQTEVHYVTQKIYMRNYNSILLSKPLQWQQKKHHSKGTAL